MTFLWLFVWLCSNAPTEHATPWWVALAVCVFLDIQGTIRRRYEYNED